MKKIIVIIDKKRGIAKNGKMPWYLPTDFKNFKQKTSTGSKIVLMTGKTFRSMKRPLSGRHNVIWTKDKSIAGEGVQAISDLDGFLQRTGDVWIIGGTALFEKTLDLADELYVTRIDHDFDCDRFFPPFENKFDMESTSGEITENGLNFHFEKWVKKR
ncbi:MAG TPA: dihydrofolate reductase [Candidatus Saccharimonadales bacterium]|nr:dihydrofolate reductase [Candidatus Saccharimonadales bacterium]